jgi:hypothetical protein
MRTVRVIVAVFFIVAMFAHITRPIKKIPVKKHYRHGALKVVFGG